MVELGVGIIAICLPTLRPLFRGWSPESIICSIRSALSLRSFHSGGSSAKRSAGRSAKDAQNLGSESSMIGIHMESTTFGKGNTEGVVTRAYGGEEGPSHKDMHDGNNIRVEQEVVLSRQEV